MQYIFAILYIVVTFSIACGLGQAAQHGINFYRNLQAYLGEESEKNSKASENRLLLMVNISFASFTLGAIFLGLSILWKVLQPINKAFQLELWHTALFLALGFLTGFLRYRIKLARQLAKMTPTEREEAFSKGTPLLTRPNPHRTASSAAHANSPAQKSQKSPEWLAHAFLCIFLLAGLAMIYFSFVI